MKERLFVLVLSMIMSLSFSFSANADGYSGFSDVAGDSAYAEAINWAAERGYVNGYDDGRFGVADGVTRSQLAAIFYRVAGSPAVSGPSGFSDVAAADYFASAVGWAQANGLINGYTDGRFGVNDPVTREQLAAILWRWAGSPVAAGLAYADKSAVADYAQTAVAWSLDNQIMAGRAEGRFAPAADATRAEVVSALYQYMNISDNNNSSATAESQTKEETMPRLKIEVDGKVFAATLLDNPSTRALLERLPMTVSMTELNGNEKYYYLPESLPTNSQKPGNIQAGDLMLYGSDCLVLFYESFASGYSYTRLGSVDDAFGLAAALGRGNVNVTFQID